MYFSSYRALSGNQLQSNLSGNTQLTKSPGNTTTVALYTTMRAASFPIFATASFELSRTTPPQGGVVLLENYRLEKLSAFCISALISSSAAAMASSIVFMLAIAAPNSRSKTDSIAPYSCGAGTITPFWQKRKTSRHEPGQNPWRPEYRQRISRREWTSHPLR